MYFNFRIRLLELEDVASKQTYLGVVEHLISENGNFRQVAREKCGGVIMKVIIMKLEISQLHCKRIARENVGTLPLIYKVSKKLARLDPFATELFFWNLNMFFLTMYWLFYYCFLLFLIQLSIIYQMNQKTCSY